MREIGNGDFVRIADVDRTGLVAEVQPNDAFHKVVDVAKGTGLQTISIDCQVFALQGLYDKVRNDTPVICKHTGAIRVEDSDYANIHLVFPMVVEKQSFGIPLALVVTSARTDRIHVASIGLGLRMNRRVAIDLAGRGMQDSGVHTLGEAEHVDRSEHRGLDRLDRVVLVMNRRCRTGHVIDSIDFDFERINHIVAKKLEICMILQVNDILLITGKKIIQAKIVVGILKTPNLDGCRLIPLPPTVTNLCHFLTTQISTRSNITPIKLRTIAITATTPESLDLTLEYNEVESRVYLAGVPKI